VRDHCGFRATVRAPGENRECAEVLGRHVAAGPPLREDPPGVGSPAASRPYRAGPSNERPGSRRGAGPV
jgi:hypothetical protein